MIHDRAAIDAMTIRNTCTERFTNIGLPPLFTGCEELVDGSGTVVPDPINPTD